jgi:hypothetical protein
LSTGGRPEIFLVLPLVLCGLGLLYLDYVRRPTAIGRYIVEIWTMLEKHPNCGKLPRGWEQYLNKEYRASQDLSRQRIFSRLPFLVVFLFPTLAVLPFGFARLISHDHHHPWDHVFWAPWALGVVFMVMLLASTLKGRWYPAGWRPSIRGRF